MTRAEFQDHMKRVYLKMDAFEWKDFSCVGLTESLSMNLTNKVYTDYSKFISPFLGLAVFKDKYRPEAPKLRQLLLRSFELEVIRSKRYLEY